MGNRVCLGLMALVLAACGSAPADQSSASEPSASLSTASPRESEPASPTADPSAGTTAAPPVGEPSVELGVTAVTTADHIRVRESPSANSAQVNELEAGSRVVVISEPVVDATDPALEWWYVMPSEAPCAGCGIDTSPGWMTTGPEGDWLSAETRQCPGSTGFTTDTWDVSEDAWGSVGLLQCFGDAPLVFEGVIDYFCCRGITFGVTEPAWLAGQYTESGIAHFADKGVSWGPELHVNPASGVELGERGTVARVTGHFDDAAAQTCVTSVDPGDLELNPDLRWVVDAPVAIWGCRNNFVVDHVEVLDFIPLPTHPPQG